MKKIIKLFMAVVLLAACSPKADKSDLTILTDDGEVNYKVEKAQTIKELEKGLMFRESLDADSGMIFDLSQVKDTAMWMKNTKIPLDMIFIEADGTIFWIFENAQPESTNLIIPPFPAAAVLELNAGDVQKHNIKPGDKVKHEFFAAAEEEAPAKAEINADEAPAEEAVIEETAEVVEAKEVPAGAEVPDVEAEETKAPAPEETAPAETPKAEAMTE